MAVLCDSAFDYGGKLCMLGCFDTMYSEALPLKASEFTFTLRVAVMGDDQGEHQFGISIVDVDGLYLDTHRMPFKINVDFSVPDHLEFVVRNYILNCHGLTFYEYGDYSLDLTYDGNLKARVPFRILEEGNLGPHIDY